MRKSLATLGALVCITLLPLAANAESNSSRLNRDRLEVGRALIEVTFDGSGAEPVLGTPVELFVAQGVMGDRIGVDPDGRFHYVRNKDLPEGREAYDSRGIVLVENWLTRFAE